MEQPTLSQVELVCELLVIDGYKAKILPKNRFPGFADADIEATKEDSILKQELLVQVKHHSGVTGTWGAEQLLEIFKQKEEQYYPYKLVLVTSAIPSKELEKLCAQKDVLLLNGNVLSEWVFKSLPKLGYETKKG